MFFSGQLKYSVEQEKGRGERVALIIKCIYSRVLVNLIEQDVDRVKGSRGRRRTFA